MEAESEARDPADAQRSGGEPPPEAQDPGAVIAAVEQMVVYMRGASIPRVRPPVILPDWIRPLIVEHRPELVDDGSVCFVADLDALFVSGARHEVTEIVSHRSGLRMAVDARVMDP